MLVRQLAGSILIELSLPSEAGNRDATRQWRRTHGLQACLRVAAKEPVARFVLPNHLRRGTHHEHARMRSVQEATSLS
jgi:hypothetical protein